jgi:hypothetical protein
MTPLPDNAPSSTSHPRDYTSLQNKLRRIGVEIPLKALRDLCESTIQNLPKTPSPDSGLIDGFLVPSDARLACQAFNELLEQSKHPDALGVKSKVNP